VECADIEVL
jgi:hypothetical protein